MTELRTIPEVIAALGGVAATAEITGCTRGAVANWRLEGRRIPARTFLAIDSELRKSGRTADPALFGMAEPVNPNEPEAA